MRTINSVFYIPHRCVVIVDTDDDYYIGQNVCIMQDDKCIIQTSISGVGKVKRSKLRELQLRNVPEGLIKQNMTIQKMPLV